MTHYIVVIRDRISGRTMQTAEPQGFDALCDVIAQWDNRYGKKITIAIRQAVSGTS